MATNGDLVGAALSETVACQHAGPEQLEAQRKGPYAPFGPFLKAPSGTGQIPTTELAMSALAELAERLLSADSRLARAVNEATMRREIAVAFSETIISISEIDDPKQRWRLLRDRTCQRISDLILDQLHYIPVWLFLGQDHDPIDVGPVRFVRRSDWLLEIANRKGESIPWLDQVQAMWSAEGTERLAPDLEPAEAIRIGQVARAVHPDQWVACTDVTGCEQHESRRRAVLATKVALDTLRLLLPLSERRNVRTAIDLAAPIGTDQMVQLRGRDIALGMSIDRPGVSGGPGLAKAIVDEGREVLAEAGVCIAQACRADEPPASELPGLRDRWFNAVHWFGRACMADEHYVAVIMLAISLDILSGGGEARGIVHLISLLTGHDPKAPVLRKGHTSLETVVTRAYKLRSEIAHGSILALHGDWEEPRVQLGALAAATLREYVLALGNFQATGGVDGKDAFASWLRDGWPAQTPHAERP